MNPWKFITENQSLITFILSGVGAFITRLVEKSRLRRKHRGQVKELQRQIELLQAENQVK